jgi:hypothetical protein
MAFLPLPPILRRRLYEDEDPTLDRRSSPPGYNDPPPPTLPELSRPTPLPGPRGVPFEAPLGHTLPRETRAQEMQTAKDVYLKKPEGRLKSTLRGALYGAVEGLRSGQGLGAGLGGAVAGGTVGAVSPRTIRRAQFETEVAPQILQRHQLEDAEAQRLRQMATDEQNAMMSRARLEDLEAGIELKRSQAEENRLPRPTPGPAPSWQRGRNRRTGQFAVFNAADPAQNAEHEPYIE